MVMHACFRVLGQRSAWMFWGETLKSSETHGTKPQQDSKPF